MFQKRLRPAPAPPAHQSRPGAASRVLATTLVRSARRCPAGPAPVDARASPSAEEPACAGDDAAGTQRATTAPREVENANDRTTPNLDENCGEAPDSAADPSLPGAPRRGIAREARVICGEYLRNMTRQLRGVRA